MLACLGGFSEDTRVSPVLWTDREIEVLRQMRAQRIRYRFIAERLGRSAGTCIAMASRFGLTRGRAVDMTVPMVHIERKRRR